MAKSMPTCALACLLAAGCGGCGDEVDERAGEDGTVRPAGRDAGAQGGGAAKTPPVGEPPPETAGEAGRREPKSVAYIKAPSRGPEPERPELGDDVLVIEIPAQELLVGSMTGQEGRDPSAEMDLVAMRMEAFSIDRYPYPNRKGAEPKTGVTLAEARELCEAEGKRLCTELEWEAACKGGVNSVYPYSQTYDPERYGKGLDALASGYGVAGMGAVEEWTDSEYRLPDNPVSRGQVIRGARPDGGRYERRCADRSYRLPDKLSSQVGFRCCSGPRNEAEVTLETLKKPFQEVTDMAPEKFGKLVNAIPELSAVHGEAEMFGESDLDYVLLRRKIDPRKSYVGYIFTTNPIWWRPMRGEELLAFSGYTGEDSFVAALYHLGEGRFKHAASMVVLGNTETSIKAPLPLILVAGVDRDVLNWGPCWNCSEGGAFYVEDETRQIQISHRW